jgi:glyoxylase-like metal-dependent hydrolase (beta-lactamase superfamily II)
MFSMSVTRAIDVMHQGLDRVLGAYEVDGVVVDPGPSTGLETLLHALESGEPRALLLTHIHLDHAGASGSLVARFPDLTVYVHERGAAHLADPSRLLASARRLYGDDMERLWGEVAPVPEERMRVLTGGEVVEGFRVAYTPGHASHHVAYLHEQSGEAYVGDVAGVRIPPFDFTIAPTPPPEVDVEAWLSSLDTLAEWEPTALCLTHFGRVADVPGQLERMRSSLRRRAEAARDGDRESFLAGLRRDVRAAVDEETAVRAEQAAPPEQLWLGLERYWRKRAERGEEVVKA